MSTRVRRWPGAVRLASVAAAGMITLACASLGVQTDYDRDIAFGAYRSYAWIDSAKIVRDSLASPFLERRVRGAVERVLIARGAEPVLPPSLGLRLQLSRWLRAPLAPGE